MIHVERIAELPGHQNPIYTAERSNKPGTFLSAGNDKGVVEWTLETQTPTVLLPVKSSVYALHQIIGTNLLAIGERSGLINIFDLKENKILHTIAHHKLPVFDIRAVPCKKELLSASEDGTVAVWNLVDFSLLYHFQVSTETVRCIAINPTETLVAFGCKDATVRIYNLDDYSFVAELNQHTLPVTAIQFSPDDRFLLSGGRDAQLHVWDTSNFSVYKSIPAHLFAIYDIKFHPTKPYFATASRDKSIKIWHAETFKLHKTISRDKGLQSHSLSVNKILWESGTETLISVSDDKLIMTWGVQFE